MKKYKNEIKGKIIEYLQETINTKRSLKRKITQMEEHIDKMMITLQEARDNEKYALEQMNKYKKKLREYKKGENNGKQEIKGGKI